MGFWALKQNRNRHGQEESGIPGRYSVIVQKGGLETKLLRLGRICSACHQEAQVGVIAQRVASPLSVLFISG